jgi:flagellar biosynthesis protein FlhF
MKQSMAEAANERPVVGGSSPALNQKSAFNDLNYIEPSEPVNELQKQLKRQGVHQEWVDEWTRLLIKAWYKSGERMERGELADLLAEHIHTELRFQATESFLPEERLISLIGPTGVGKTTTLAKLAAKAVIEQSQKVAFITVDTYRIAAIEQLKTYAGILNAPVEVVYTSEDFKQALEKLKDCDRIFIDTAGRNYREDHYVEELTALLPLDQSIAVYLVMSATSKDEDMTVILNQFKRVHLKGMILTKLDETASIGSLLNLLLHHPDQTLSFVTNGQDVPDDIEKASADKLTSQLLAVSEQRHD